jgi:hypothetical protein
MIDRLKRNKVLLLPFVEAFREADKNEKRRKEKNEKCGEKEFGRRRTALQWTRIR